MRYSDCCNGNHANIMKGNDMMDTNKKIMSMAVAASVAVSGLAYAGNSSDEAREMQLFNQATVSLVDAVKAAEKKVGGKAMDASLDDESKTIQFEIQVLKDGQVHHVMVDGKTGSVVKVSMDDEKDAGTETGGENDD